MKIKYKRIIYPIIGRVIQVYLTKAIANLIQKNRNNANTNKTNEPNISRVQEIDSTHK